MAFSTILDSVFYRLQQALGNAVGEAIADDLIRRTITYIPTGDVKTIAGTPILVIPAPGAGEYLEFVSAQVFLNYASTPYTGVSGNTWGFVYSGGAQCSKPLALEGFLDLTANAYRHLTAANECAPSIGTAIEIAGLAGEVADGNSQVEIEVAYRVRTALTTL